MALQRLTHSGIAPPTTLGSPITSSALSFTIASASGYPTGAGGPFVIDIDAGTSSEEKVLCQSLAGTTITVFPGGRGFDGTTPTAHSPAPGNVTHVCSSAELDDANAHIYVPTRDDHTQYVRTDGSRSITGGLTVAGNLTVGGAIGAASVQAATLAASGFGFGRFVGGTPSGPPGSGAWLGADFVVDETGAIWVCTAGGTPGTWVKVGGSTAYPQTVQSVSNLLITTTSPVTNIVTGTGAGLFRINCHIRTTASGNLSVVAAGIDERGSTFGYLSGLGTYWQGAPVGGAISIPMDAIVIRAAAGQTAYLEIISSVANVVYVSATIEQLSNT